MDDLNQVIFNELKDIKNKIEKLDEKFDKEIEPLKTYVTQLRAYIRSAKAVGYVVIGIMSTTVGFLIKFLHLN